MTIVDDSGLVPCPPMPLRRPAFWMALIALLLLVSGLLGVALPEPLAGPVVWMLDTHHGWRLSDVVGAALLAVGSVLTWVIVLVWQWQHAR